MATCSPHFGLTLAGSCQARFAAGPSLTQSGPFVGGSFRALETCNSTQTKKSSADAFPMLRDGEKNLGSNPLD